MTSTKLFAVAVVLVAAILPASATTVVVGCGGCGFQSWNAGQLNEDGAPYFDTPSADGSQKNAGYFLSKTGAFSSNAASPAITPPFWAQNATTPDTSYYLNTDTGYNGVLKIEVAALAGLNIVGWYNIASPGTLHPLLGGGVTSTTFTPTANFGFYILTGNGFTFYTQSGLNTSSENNTAAYEQGHQHFTFFKENATTFWMAVEDKSLADEIVAGGSYGGDYNDMIFKLTEVSQIPEPSTWFMVASGAAFVTLSRFRRK